MSVPVARATGGFPTFASIDQEQVTITAGSGADVKSFTVFKKLLFDASPYFKVGFAENRWQQGEIGLLKLADVSATTLIAFLDWLYFAHIPKVRPIRPTLCSCSSCVVITPGMETEFQPAAAASQTSEHLQQNLSRTGAIVDLYIFADRYDVPKLRRDLVDHAWDWVQNGGPHRFAWDVILWACQTVPGHTCFFKLMADVFLAHFEIGDIRCSNIQTLCHSMPPHLLIKAFAAVSKPDRPKVETLCAYHEHDNNATENAACKRRQQVRVLNADIEKRSADTILKAPVPSPPKDEAKPQSVKRGRSISPDGFLSFSETVAARLGQVATSTGSQRARRPQRFGLS